MGRRRWGVRHRLAIAGAMASPWAGCGLTLSDGAPAFGEPAAVSVDAAEPAPEAVVSELAPSETIGWAETGLIGWWRFDGSAAAETAASAGALVDVAGMLQTGATRGMAGSLQTVEFDGSDSAGLVFPNSVSAHIAGDLSVTLLVNLHSLPTEVNRQPSFVHHGIVGEAEADNVLYNCGIQGAGKVFYHHEWGVGDTNDISLNNEELIFDALTLQDGLVEWVHLTWLRDAAAQTVQVFRNGMAMQTLTYQHPPSGGEAGKLWFGANASVSGGGVRSVDASLAEVRLYSRVLTAEQVRALAEAALQQLNGS